MEFAFVERRSESEKVSYFRLFSVLRFNEKFVFGKKRARDFWLVRFVEIWWKMIYLRRIGERMSEEGPGKAPRCVKKLALWSGLYLAQRFTRRRSTNSNENDERNCTRMTVNSAATQHLFFAILNINREFIQLFTRSWRVIDAFAGAPDLVETAEKSFPDSIF